MLGSCSSVALGTLCGALCLYIFWTMQMVLIRSPETPLGGRGNLNDVHLNQNLLNVWIWTCWLLMRHAKDAIQKWWLCIKSTQSYYKHAEAINYHLTLDQPNLELPQTLRLVLQHHFITWRCVNSCANSFSRITEEMPLRLSVAPFSLADFSWISDS